MAKYGIFGGLAGPWKKEKIDKFEPVVANIEISLNTDNELVVIADKTFSDISKAITEKKFVYGKVHNSIENVDSLVYLAEYDLDIEDGSIDFSNTFFDIVSGGGEPTAYINLVVFTIAPDNTITLVSSRSAATVDD